MRCLSIRQPWATLIVTGYKDVENRTWRTSYRGPLLIHATRTPDLAARTHGLLTRGDIAGLPCGGIIGAVMLDDCVTTAASQWFEGPFGWLLSQPTLCRFRPCRGQLRLWNLVEEEEGAGGSDVRRLLPSG